jgi:hypothetical protein
MEEGRATTRGKWAENVKKTGVDPATVMKELKAQLSKEGAGY